MVIVMMVSFAVSARAELVKPSQVDSIVTAALPRKRRRPWVSVCNIMAASLTVSCRDAEISATCDRPAFCRPGFGPWHLAF
jgi:hypothetical protein